jgi:hypothetical protein
MVRTMRGEVVAEEKVFPEHLAEPEPVEEDGEKRMYDLVCAN